MALTVTVVSFSLADNENNGALVDEAAFVSATVDTNTNIDNIIENSYMTGEGADPVYRVVEIGSGSPSSLKAFVELGGFENYVINGNKTIESVKYIDEAGVEQIKPAVMNAKCITYEFYKASAVADDNETALAAISKADFIYVSNDASNKYSTSNDMGEELYNILHTYAVGDYKPFLIDDIGDPQGTGGGGGGGNAADYSLTRLASELFDKSGKYYYTFKWDVANVTAEEFVTHTNGSKYLGINGDKKSANWTQVTEKANITDGVLAEGAKKYKVADILVIKNGAAAGMYDGLTPEGVYATPLTDLVDLATGQDVVGDIFNFKDTLLYNNGYNGRYARPDYVRVTKLDITGDITELETISLDKYDLVIIEEECKTAASNETLFRKLAAAMYGSVNIIYPASMSTGSSSGSGSTSTGGNASVQQETNYSELYYMVATNSGQERYENVMITNKSEFDIIANSNSAATCKVIADLINASAFRGNGGPKGSANKFTVLEIQPCYPIDTALADKNGNYYTIPSDVINGKTKEELDEGTEYYAWELSKAKIAKAMNISADQVTIVQMSTEQLASTKEDILGNYDLVYVGGNISALKQAQFYSSYGMTLSSTNFNKLGMPLENLKKLPIYEMYAHTGELVITDLSALGQASGTVTGNVPSAYVNINGTMQKSYGMLNGNDITYNKLIQLEQYIDAGMPVVFSKTATLGYRAADEAGYLQNSIDPDCNMFKFMSYCAEDERDNVLWNFDESALIDVDNNGGDYGDTQTGYVSVFADAQSTELQQLYLDSSKRPKITLTQTPKLYNMYDDNSIITDKKLNFKYKVTGSTKYQVSLYVDDDGNSVFDANEVVATGNNESLEFTAADSFYGPVYWQIVVTDNNKQKAATKGISYIANSKTSKQKVRILQIMPGQYNGAGKRNADAGETAQGKNSLYFCTICQQAYERLEYNPSAESGDRLDYTALYDGRMVDHENGLSYQGNAGKIYLGLHEHEFGIVKYDSGMKVKDKTYVGADDWDLNLADEVRDKYDFDIEIMMRSEFVDTSNAIAKAYDFSKLSDAEKATLTATNPYAEGTADYEDYEKASVDEKLVAIYNEKYEKEMVDYLNQYTAYTSLIAHTDEEFKDAFKDYQYFNELKLEVNELTADQKTASGLSQSTIDAEIDLRIALAHMRDELGANTFAGQEIHRLLTTRHYWDYYSTQNGKYTNKENWYVTADGENINTLYQTYVTLKDKEILANNEYKKYSRFLSGSEWMFDSYDMLVIGASEDFANDDITEVIDGKTVGAANALADLDYYLGNGGSVLMFHDTVTRFDDAGSVHLTKTVQKYAAMDRFNMEIDKTKTDDLAASHYVPYLSTDPDKYFMTNLSVAGSTSTGANKYKNWHAETDAVFDANSSSAWFSPSKLYVSDVAYTDSSWVVQSNGGSHHGQMPYKYAELEWAKAAIYARDDQTYITAKQSGNYGADKASRTNEGIVTLYPFTLSDQLNVSFTHAQAYALDLENDDVTVWYSMGGGTGTKLGSSVYAASPNDGMDSYFIYTYENFNYCGAGHCNVTGVGKDNNDERRLYINIICNSVKKSIAQPDIFVYDYGTTNNKKIKKSGDMYVTKVDSMEEYPEFSFLVKLDEDADISKVRIYYDLDFLTTNLDAYVPNDPNHLLIADWTNEQVKEATLTNVFRYDRKDLETGVSYILKKLLDKNGNGISVSYVSESGATITTLETMLKLQPAYFDPYNGQYTYIVIEITDDKGNISYKRIKIQLKDKLFNLT